MSADPFEAAVSAEPFRIIELKNPQGEEKWKCSVRECEKRFKEATDCIWHVFHAHTYDILAGLTAASRAAGLEGLLITEEARTGCVTVSRPGQQVAARRPGQPNRTVMQCRECLYSAKRNNVRQHYPSFHLIKQGRLECNLCTAFWDFSPHRYIDHQQTLCIGLGEARLNAMSPQGTSPMRTGPRISSRAVPDVPDTRSSPHSEELPQPGKEYHASQRNRPSPSVLHHGPAPAPAVKRTTPEVMQAVKEDIANFNRGHRASSPSFASPGHSTSSVVPAGYAPAQQYRHQ